MKIVGTDRMTQEQIIEELRRGAQFVVFEYCVSIIVMTFKRPSEIHFIRAQEDTFKKHVGYSFMTLLLGWWGIPWGPIYTFSALWTNLRGGRDMTRPLLDHWGWTADVYGGYPPSQGPSGWTAQYPPASPYIPVQQAPPPSSPGMPGGAMATAGGKPRKPNELAAVGFLISLIGAICFPPLALIGLILSVVGLVRASRAPSREGRGIALAGIVICCLAIGLAVPRARLRARAAKGLGGGSTAAEAANRLESRRKSAERLFRAGSATRSFGNTPEAKQMAREFSEGLQAFVDGFFVDRSSKGGDSTRSNLMTYCELHDDRCLFLVYVPDMRRYSSKAAEHLGTLAWTVGQSQTMGKQHGRELEMAIGLRGVFLYDSIWVGKNSGSPERKNGSQEYLLNRFFEDDAPTTPGLRPRRES